MGGGAVQIGGEHKFQCKQIELGANFLCKPLEVAFSEQTFDGHH